MMKHIEIEDYIVKNIQDGTYGPDDLILSENQLAAKFKVSRMTARKAISNLISRNFLYQIMGKGTYVLDRKHKTPINLDKTIDFDERTIAKRQKPETKLTSYEMISPNIDIKDIFKDIKFTEVLNIERLRMIDDIPAIYEMTYIPDCFLSSLDDGQIDVLKYQYAKRVKFGGHKIVIQIKEFSAVLPGPKVQKALNIGERTPALLLEVVSYLDNNLTVEYSKVFYNQAKYKFVHEITI
ncbi:MAG TPA: GntR family transcriptional regulator [Victivallales bacterium]|nr:GntR family transcriptional regulator [Victivallales bacterium]